MKNSFISSISIFTQPQLFHGAENADLRINFQRGGRPSRNQMEKKLEIQREIDGRRNQMEKKYKIQREIEGRRNQMEK